MAGCAPAGRQVISYIVVYRTREGRQRTYTIGKHGSPWSPNTARQAADLGYNEPTIASLLGHKTHSITSRYVHSADVVLLAAADAVISPGCGVSAGFGNSVPISGSATSGFR